MIEIQKYQLSESEFEREALNHYTGRVSSQLMHTLREAVMVFHNILPELCSKGVKLRIVPKGTNLTDLPECIDLKVFKTKQGENLYDRCLGVYKSRQKLVVIKEESLLEENSPNQKFTLQLLLMI